MRIKMYSKMLLINSLLLVVNPVFADKKMTTEEVRALFSNKTYEGIHVIKNKKFRVYDSAAGKHKVEVSGGGTKERYWWVNSGSMLCISKKKNTGGKCKNVFSSGNGVYLKVKPDGTHTHTLKNFVSGNKL